MIYSSGSLYVREAKKCEWDEAMELAWKNFMIFDSKDYSQRGIESFREFISNVMLHKMFLIGSYIMLLAFKDDKIVGMITLRSKTHISLLFVEEAYQRQGIGSTLIKFLGDYIQEAFKARKITVNSSPFAVMFYHEMGFEDTGVVEVNDGISFTPMEMHFKGV